VQGVPGGGGVCDVPRVVDGDWRTAGEMSLVPDLTKTAVISLDRSASDSPNSSVSDRARDSIVSTQRLLPYSSPPAHAPAAAAGSDVTSGRRRRCPRDVTLPSNVDNDALVWSTVTSAGGRVTLPGSGHYCLILSQ